jgi:site-specific recombinase XerD
VKLTSAIDSYIDDMRQSGRMNSPSTERDYRGALLAHAKDVENRDPRYTNREDVKRTLRRWSHPNSQRKQRSILVSFYDWTVEEGYRPHNPARQTRRAKRRPTEVYRLSKGEVVRLLGAVRTTRERRAIYLGVCAGLRSAELRGLQGRHFQRLDFIWVSADIAKGKRERWVPISGELAPVVREIRRTLDNDDYVLPAQRWRDPGVNRNKFDKRKHPMSPKALWELVKKIGQRAGIAAPLHPHLMRHAYGDHVARYAGVRNAQHLLGHAGIGTTETYLAKPTPDELSGSVAGFAFGVAERLFYPLAKAAAIPVEATTGIEPV